MTTFIIPQHQGLQYWDMAESSWNKAAQATQQGDPFCCGTQWQLSYHEAFNQDRALTIRESSDSLVALTEAPASLRPNLYTPVESLWFYGCPLMGPAAVDLFEQAMTDIALNIPANEPDAVFLISGLRPGGTLYRQLKQRFACHFGFQKFMSETQLAASLTGGLDGFLSRRSAGHRRNLKKQSKRAVRKGVYFERCCPKTESEADRIYDRLLQIEQASWKGLGECGMNEPSVSRFYHLMLKRLAVSGDARIIMARHEDIDIGFIFGGVVANIYRGQQFSFTEDWRQSSIGNLLQLEQISWLCEEGIRRYDMGPLMDYKYHWTEKRFNLETWILKPR